MRTKLSVLAATVAMLFAGAAQADTISLIWQGSGTATTSAAPSATITANIVLTITQANTGAMTFSVDWDLDSGNELDYVGGSCAATGVGGTNWQNICLFEQGNTAGNPGQTSQYGFQGTPDSSTPMTQSTQTIGTVTFHVVAPNTDGNDVEPGFTNPTAFDVCLTTGFSYCGGAVVLNGASVIPEPATVGLITMGLAGLALMGRGARRS